MYSRIVKSKCILTKLCVLDYEYICDRIAKFHKKILFITRVINIQILTTKYFSFQYSVTYILQSGKWRNHVINKHGIFGRRSYTLIKVLRKEKGDGAKRLVREFPGKPWTLSGLSYLLKKIDERRPGSGWKRTVRTNENVQLVEELVLSTRRTFWTQTLGVLTSCHSHGCTLDSQSRLCL